MIADSTSVDTLLPSKASSTSQIPSLVILAVLPNQDISIQNDSISLYGNSRCTQIVWVLWLFLWNTKICNLNPSEVKKSYWMFSRDVNVARLLFLSQCSAVTGTDRHHRQRWEGDKEWTFKISRTLYNSKVSRNIIWHRTMATFLVSGVKSSF